MHKISFIAQDVQDSRAFGYIYGSPENGHRFFGIKTEKAAGQVHLLLILSHFCLVFKLMRSIYPMGDIFLLIVINSLAYLFIFKVVVAMRDLFQVVFELKKRQIEDAKANINGPKDQQAGVVQKSKVCQNDLLNIYF